MPFKAPSLKALQEISARLSHAKINFALGGSGLLAQFGFQGAIRDWDLTTDAPLTTTFEFFRDLQHTIIEPNGIFATAYMAKIQLVGASFDLMGNFSKAFRRSE